MRATLCVAMLAVCLIALQCTADGDADAGISSPPLSDPNVDQSDQSGAGGHLTSHVGFQDSGEELAPGVTNRSSSSSSSSSSQAGDTNSKTGSGTGAPSSTGSTGQLAGSGSSASDVSLAAGAGTGRAATVAEPSSSTGFSVSSIGTEEDKGSSGQQSVPDASSDKTTTTTLQAKPDNNNQAPQDQDQLSPTDRTSVLPSADQDPKLQASDSSSPTEYSARTQQPPLQPQSPPTTLTLEDTNHDNTDNLVQQNTEGAPTVPSKQVRQLLANVNPINNPTGHSSNKEGDPEEAAAEPIAGVIPPAPPLQGHSSTLSTAAKPPVSSPPLKSDGITNEGQNTGTNIAASQTNTPTTLHKVNRSVNIPTHTSTTNTAATNTIKPSTNSATFPAKNQATPNSEEKESHQQLTLKTTTSTAAPTASKETSVTSTTESAKVHSNAPAPPLPKLSTSLQSLDNKDSSIGSVSHFALTTLAALAVTVVLSAL